VNADRLAIIWDTETTGLTKHPSAKRSAQPRIIEFGAALVTAAGEVVDELNILIEPGVPLEAEITKITGITADDLIGAPTFATVAQRIRSMFARASLQIAHNLPFDMSVLEFELERTAQADWPWPARSLCTVQEHAEEFGFRPKLTTLFEVYNGRPLEQTHRAIEDVRALLTICIASGVLKDNL
jgi:DNA polymerase III epsilon subunit-like protein